MNDLINMKLELTMSSLEIATLVEKRHDNVKRTIETLADNGVIVRPQIEDEQKTDSLGRLRSEKVFMFEGERGKRDSIIVVAQLSPEFTARLVDRWQELENASKQQLPDFTNPAEAARAWATEYEQKLIAQEKLSIAAPKVDVYDRIVERNGLYNATQIAQKFGQSAIWLNKQLASMGVYNRSVKRGRVFQQWFIDNGYGIMRETENGFSQPMFYAEGEMWIVRKLSEEGLI